MTKNAHKVLTSNGLKCIAVAAMFFDHFFSVFLVQEGLAGSLLRITGRVAAPIMCYLVAEGFAHTRNVRKYLGRLTTRHTRGRQSGPCSSPWSW